MSSTNPTSDVLQAIVEKLDQLIKLYAQSEKVIIFIDNSNFYGSLSRISHDLSRTFRVDYAKLKNVLVKDRSLIDAYCYYSDWNVASEAKARREGFQYMIEKSGFTLIKLLQKTTSKEKGIDAAIVRDMTIKTREVPRCDTFILVAGDGDYADTVRELRRRDGVNIEVAFFDLETSSHLKSVASKFTDLEPLKDSFHLERE